ncbi:MAG: secondary thiamine-phosphate synthase enzyme YjbQ [Patescibacteria group bacterium]|nr:secondary thiamine-phosphate synthase enzyme YjbQ [Patescibacteria group bacterium]
MRHISKTLELSTKKQFELIDITPEVRKALSESGVKNGSITVFCPHTTAAIRLNHNEPLLIQDIMRTLYHLVPMDVSYSHDLFEMRQTVSPNERSNGHAHVKAFLLGSSENLIVKDAGLQIGKMQSVMFVELDGGRSRQVHIQILGE